MVWGALCGEENARSEFFDHSWALFWTYLAGLEKKLRKSERQKS
jgi:hypothetical protein